MGGGERTPTRGSGPPSAQQPVAGSARLNGALLCALREESFLRPGQLERIADLTRGRVRALEQGAEATATEVERLAIALRVSAGTLVCPQGTGGGDQRTRASRLIHGEALRALRIRKGVLAIELALRAGISHGTLADIEHGRRDGSPVVLDKLARALDVPKTVLMRDPARRDDVVRPSLDTTPA